MDPLEQAIMQNASDLGVDPGVELEQQAAVKAEEKRQKVQAPAVYKDLPAIDPDIAKLDAQMGIDRNELAASLNDQALMEHEESVNTAVTEYLKKGDAEFAQEGRNLGLYIKSLITPADKTKQTTGERVAEYAASTLANIAMVPGKWIESATNAVADVTNAIGRKYNWNGGNDVLGTMEYFKSAQQQLPDGQVPAKLVEYAAPTVGLIGKGVSLTKAAVMSAAISSVVTDPDDKRLADMVKGTWVEKIPLVAEAIDYLAYDPTDSNLTKRWKNGLESLGVDIMVAGGFGVARAVRADAKAELRAMNDVADPVEKELSKKAADVPKPPAPTSPETGAIKVEPETIQQVADRQRETLKELGAGPVEDIPLLMAEPGDFSGIALRIQEVPHETVIIKSGEEITIKAEMVSMGRSRSGTQLADMPGVVAYDKNGTKIGEIAIGGEVQNGKFVAASAGTEVVESQRRKGVATAMYNYANKYIADVHPSYTQSDAGRDFSTAYRKTSRPGPSPDVVAAEAELAAAAKEPGEAVRTYKTKVATEKLVKAQEAQLDDLARARLNSTPEMQAAYIARAEQVVQETADAVGITKTQADGLADKFDTVFTPAGFTSTNAEVTSTLGRLFKTIAETEQSRGPMKLADMYAMGGTLKEDIDFLEQVAGRQMGDLMHAEGTVAVKALLADMWDDFAVKAKASSKEAPETVAAMAEAYENMQRLAHIASGYSEEAARTLGIHKHINSLIDSGNAEAVAMVRKQMASKIVMDRITSAGGMDKIQNMAELVMEAEATVKNMDFSLNAKGEIESVAKWAKIADGLVTYINNARLNSVSLLGRISTSSVLMTGRRLLTNLNEAIIGGVVKADEVPSIASALADIQGIAAARSEAAQVAAETWKSGISKGPTVNMDLEQIKVSALPAFAGNNIAAEAWNKVGVLLGSGRRGIMTVEAASGMLNYRGIVAGKATQAADAAQLTGKAREEFIMNYMSNPPTTVHETAVEAINDINLTGQVTTKWIDRFVANPTGGLGKYHPLSMLQKLMVPFGNTRGRFLEEAMTNVPVANLLVKDNWRKFTSGSKAERTRMAAELAVGMETIGVVGYLVQNGLLTGGPSPDYKTNKLLADSEKGWKPYSVRVGDKFVEIPFADNTLKKIIDVSAYMSYSAMSAITDEQEHGEALSLAAMAIGHVLSPDDNLRTGGQITSVVKGILEGRDMTEQAKSLVASPVIGLNPIAGVVRDYNLAFGDNTVKDYKSADGLMDYVKMRMEATLPGLSANVPPARNLFGEVILAQTGKALFGSFLASQDVKGDEVTERLRLLSGFYDMQQDQRNVETVAFSLSEPPREITVMGVPVKLTKWEYDEFAYRVGQDLDVDGKNLKDRFYDILIDQGSPVFEYVASYGKIMPEDYDNDRMAMAYSNVMAAVVSNYKQRQDTLELEFGQRPEIRDRAMEIIRARNESAVKGFQTVEKFMGVK